MTCWFFMSYRRADDEAAEGRVRTFYERLKNEVSARVGDQTPPLAWIDRESLKPGDPWPDELAHALCTCRTFVAVMTARYFASEYCGKEWGIFEERCRRLGGHVLPPLIIPVLWVPPVGEELPEFAMRLHMTFDPRLTSIEAERPLLADYGKYGLEHIVSRASSSHADIYKTIVEQLAVRIIQVAKAHELQPLDASALPSLADAPNRFASVEPIAPQSANAASRANFAFIAGTAQQMAALRKDAERYYGASDARDWMPCAPDETEQIGWIAQSAATDKKLIVNWLVCDSGLISALERAEEENSVAIVIVDPWTARHPEYRSMLTRFDRFRFRNCVVLIPWNRSDPQTEGMRESLREQLKQTLRRSFEMNQASYFRSDVSAKDLRTEIAGALTELERMLAPHRQPARRVDASEHVEPPQIAATRR